MRNLTALKSDPERYAAFLAKERARDTIRRAANGSRSGKHTHTYLAIDGEEIGGQYSLLGCSNGESITDLTGLKTEACLVFLLSVGGSADKTLIGFGIDYDVNQWIADLPRKLLERIWRYGTTLWRGKTANYRLTWIPGKQFSVSEVSGGKSLRTVTVWDLFGFSRKGFADTLRSFGVQCPQLVDDMKAQRGTFDADNLSDIAEYNAAECRLIVELFGRRLRPFLQDVAPGLFRYDGAGAVASNWLSAVSPEVFGDPCPQENAAYHGGRAQSFQIGRFPEAYSYDLNSAYAAALSILPRLGDWREVTDYVPYRNQTGVWFVEWDTPGEIIAPFPWRSRSGSVSYPRSGCGWYWSPLVREAVRLYGDMVRPKQGIVTGPFPGSPFSWVEGHYAERRAWGGGYADLLKLSLSALYGKLLQGGGARGYAPKYRSISYAGLLTSIIHGKLLAVMGRDPASIISVSTDGFLSTNPDLTTQIGFGLGEWKREKVTDVFSVTPGCYSCLGADGRRIVHSSGVPVRDWPDEELRSGWDEQGPDYKQVIPSREFVGLGSALGDGKLWPKWRSWRNHWRTVKCSPGSGRAAGPVANGSVRWEQPEPSEGVSCPYEGR